MASSLDAATLFTEVDGNALSGLNAYRHTSDDPGFYCTYLVNDSIPGSLFGADMSLDTGVFPSLVQTTQTGYYLALKPLSQGWHTLHFGGEQPVLAPDGTNSRRTSPYNINVVPEPGLLAFGAAAFLPLAGLMAARWRRAR